MVAGLEFSTLPQQLVTGLLIGAIYALVALGYTMVYGVLKLINFAHGEVFMLGAYVALFASWSMGYTPNNALQQGSWLALVIMFLASVVVCGIVGVIIERFAYRPMRNQARIASLITAIGVSLMLQYAGQLFLLNGVPQSIDSKVSPAVGNLELTYVRQDPKLAQAAKDLQAEVDKANAAYQPELKLEGGDEFNLQPKGQALKAAFQEAQRKQEDAQNAAANSARTIYIPRGQVIMLVTTFLLMGILRFLVMQTRAGRAMRAVSHDFDSASLMGINVNSIVTFTFFLGSALAGAGAMMAATFQTGTKIDTFFGVLPGVKAFVAAVLGGIGNIPGAVLGGLLMGLAENLVVWAGYGGFKDAIAFVILIAVLLFRPGGLLGSSKVEKV